MRPVFIIGGSRTGSNLVQSLLRDYTDIDIAGEMWLFCPRWLHEDFNNYINRKIGATADPDKLDNLLELMYSKEPFGSFWKYIGSRIDKDELKQQLLNTDLSLRSIFSVLLEAHAKRFNKKTPGAKFPVHYSYYNKLIEWFPDCRVIHTMRDPRAVYSSQSYKRASNPKPNIGDDWTRFTQFFHVMIQAKWTATVHRNLKRRTNYLLCKYEDLVTNPEHTLTTMCQFLEVPFVPEMLSPKRNNSSYNDIRTNAGGFHKKSLNAWQNRISPTTAKFIKIITYRELQEFGYLE